MQNGSDAKQLVAEQLKQVTNVLVTVEKDPTVDELAGALALTLMLNKLDKRATAVFSGAMPPAISFLEPDKTFEPTVDSLRDFIIALDKEKADRLRYKVEGDMVKIYLTPYKTVLSQKDLEFSEGDFNVEVIVALGVEKNESLDRAIAAHGRILHDATVITINTKQEQNDLGALDWQDGTASSISEMLVGLAQAIEPQLLDGQISTALLTGIVAATERFSNNHTTAHVMNIAAELMAAGANQQLIANNLQSKNGYASSVPKEEVTGELKPDDSQGKKELSEAPLKIDKRTPNKSPKKESKKADKNVVEPEEGSAEKPPENSVEPTIGDALPKEDTVTSDIPMDAQLNGLKEALESVAKATPENTPAPTDVTSSLLTSPEKKAPAVDLPLLPPAEPPTAEAAPLQPRAELPKIHPLNQHGGDGRAPWQELEPPTMGGTLNATAAEAANEKQRQEAEDQKRRVTLMHRPPINAASPMQPPMPVPAPAPIPEPSQMQPVPLPMPEVPPPVPFPAPTPAEPVPSPGIVPGSAVSQPAMPPMPPLPEPFPAAQFQPMPAPSQPTATPAPALAQAPAPPVPAEPPFDLDSARAAVSEALSTQPLDPAGRPMSEHTPQTLNALPSPEVAPAPAGHVVGSLPSLPAVQNLYAQPRPGQDMTQQFMNDLMPPAPPAPGLPPAQVPPAAPAPGQITPPASGDPSQFQIPGQQTPAA